MAPIPRLRDEGGHPLWSYGFRPFFLFGSLFAAAAMLAWLPAYYGAVTIPTAMAPRDWHAHEMIFGFLPAVVTGFLLTAIPNWTGRLPLQGKPLMVLCLVWASGRVAISTSSWTSLLFAALVDVSFLALVAAAATREVVAGRNWRNLRVVAVVGLLLAGNATFHAEAIFTGSAEFGTRMGIAAAVLLITIVGGRVVPSFTRNWLKRERFGALPATFGKVDATAIAATGLALLLWVAAPAATATGAALAVAGVAQSVRLARWSGFRTWRDRLVVVLHVAYAFIPLGFLLTAGASFEWLSPSAGTHAWTVGAVGLMVIAIMSRASLGHTGRPLVASRSVQAVYLLLLSAAILRICAVVHPSVPSLLLFAWLTWTSAFALFAASYWRVFLGPRLRT
ncbi:MAG TPA: NnrS family protein [Bosea sp. (in: a-proteobacteria)]|jgi:uncharacterized protein involved in response to NO|uniref:NnrS family protein n=1 Tax=Bosea sp. (in: a-proteobacteria) TaxID=1871050 RepID=UPI002DDD81F5|nr:NnrS family protein [Bosea sp. (in: a-proteobacteria)]HEV2552996.1 NnrS family protein [Bosea sp. (in: a-proteobacteria)]